MIFKAEYHNDGMIKEFTCRGNPHCGIIGCFDSEGKLWLPDLMNVQAELPGHLFKMIGRAKIWEVCFLGGKPQCLSLPLETMKRETRGIVFFWPL